MEREAEKYKRWRFYNLCATARLARRPATRRSRAKSHQNLKPLFHLLSPTEPRTHLDLCFIRIFQNLREQPTMDDRRFPMLTAPNPQLHSRYTAAQIAKLIVSKDELDFYTVRQRALHSLGPF